MRWKGLPETWESRALGEVADITMGQSPPGSSYNQISDGCPFLQGNAEFGVESPAPSYWTTEPRKMARKGSVLFSVRAPIGAVNIANTDYCIGRGLSSVSLHRGDNKYLYYLLRYLKPSIEQKGTGSTFKSITKTTLEDLVVPLPPLDTQRKIVAILDKAEATQRLRAEADALTQELQRSAFLEIFGNPVKNEKGWIKKPLREFGEIITGNTPPRERAEYYGNHIEWIKSDNINTPFTYLTRSEEMLSKQGADVGRIAPKGSVLITCIAGSISCIGNTAIADREVAFNQQINAIVPNKSVNPVFLYHLFRNSQGYIQKFSTHSMKGMISKGVLSSIPLILPPVEIQNSFASIAQQIEEIRNQQHESTYEVSSLLNALMSKAFIGELISN
ncbi:type I restriction enzyme, S subunit [Methanoculleus bourgensis MS2]|uniref:Type I restriction enzyme, S subunit n=1 Tax=Methanoculleus bourgensis (strain ATCC 43281 / DSM 3045 / OCM 15 / MS2) TaxID=1201294 RepID=I7LJJ2_METBM|nr:restriction endonuclease subunit S [Methanoculleus bourgensis]CCJ36022.1 type I restriction enzyme, S subunit [Methanoculleus bourgensis MS2]